MSPCFCGLGIEEVEEERPDLALELSWAPAVSCDEPDCMRPETLRCRDIPVSLLGTDWAALSVPAFVVRVVVGLGELQAWV